ncbi:MAG: hypothetical protein QOF51_87 [Chloroflexota bacterium]|nr:hypothetical protein [Chloroflexota bacterium]
MAADDEGAKHTEIRTAVDADMLAAVDAFVRQHSGANRDSVIADALHLWLAREQDREMEAQFSGEPSALEAEERAAWRRIHDASAGRLFGKQ